MIDFRLGRFAIVGLANTVLGLAIIFACKALLGMPDALANFVGYATALLLGFSLNRRWTFAYDGSSATAFIRYLLVLACAYAANLATVVASISLLGIDSYLAQAAGIAPYTLTNYLGSRLFAFRKAAAECSGSNPALGR
jgi:putative flippase GtrA